MYNSLVLKFFGAGRDDADRLYVSLGGFPIYVYGIIIACAILVAFLVGAWLCKKVGYRDSIAYLILLFAVPIGIVLARAYYIIFDGAGQYKTFLDIINIRNGGMAIYGGIIGGALGIFIVSRIKRCGDFTLTDIVVMVVALAQAIGRLGNLANMEAYGVATAHHVPPFTVDIHGTPHLATYFLESMMNLIGFGVMLFLFFYLRRHKRYRWGFTSGFYLVWYGVARMIVEPFRTDSLLIHGSSQMIFNRVSFVLSIALVALGVLLLVATRMHWTSQENTKCQKPQAPKTPF